MQFWLAISNYLVNKKAIELAILWHFYHFNTIFLSYKKIDQRSYNEISVNNTVQKSEDNVYHEIVHIVEHNRCEHLNNGYAYEQGHHLHYGYAHHTNHYHDNMLTNLEANDYQSKVSKHLGGYTKINDRISHYSTPIDRLQTLLRKNNSQNEDQSGRDA